MAQAAGGSSSLLRLGAAIFSRRFLSGGAHPALAGSLVDVAHGRGCGRTYGSLPEEAEEIPESESTEGWGQTRIRELLNWKRDQGQWLFCSKDDLVFDAVKKMANANVGSLVVFDPSKMTVEGGKKITSAPGEAIVGIITERDYLTKMVVEGRSSKETLVSEVMTPESKLIMVTPEHSVAETMQIMADKNVRHLPVVHRNSMLGMVSIRDVVKVMVMEHRQEMDQMQQYIQGMY